MQKYINNLTRSIDRLNREYRSNDLPNVPNNTTISSMNHLCLEDKQKLMEAALIQYIEHTNKVIETLQNSVETLQESVDKLENSQDPRKKRKL